MDLIFFIKKNFMIIFLIIANVYLLYKYKCNGLEKMSNTDEIEDKINRIYKADVESIRNLSEVAKTLQKEGLTIPGNLTVKGKLSVGKDSTIKGNHLIGKQLTTNGDALTHGHHTVGQRCYIQGKTHSEKSFTTNGHIDMLGNLTFLGENRWIIDHNRNKNNIYIAPSKDLSQNNWDYNKGTSFQALR